MDTVKPTPTFNEAALASQRECVNGAIVLETEIADMLQSQ